MAAAISFYTGPNAIYNLSGSGLGFYGDSGFGASVQVGSYNGRTYITNSAGSTQGPEGNNIKYLNSGSGIIGQSGSGTALLAIPNYQASLNVRFTYDSAVKVQSAEARIYDRYSTNNNPSGVTAKMAELIHPDTSQTSSGSGDSTWYTPGGSGVVVPLANSPGPSGLFAANGLTSLYTSDRHDWYLALSCSPDSLGSKTLFGLSIQTEYL